MFGKESVFQLNFCIDCQHSCFMLVTNYPNLLKSNREQSFLRWPDTVKLPEITLRKTMLKKYYLSICWGRYLPYWAVV